MRSPIDNFNMGHSLGDLGLANSTRSPFGNLGAVPSISDYATAESARLSFAGLGAIPSISDQVAAEIARLPLAGLGAIPSISDQVTAESAKLSLAGLGAIPSISDQFAAEIARLPLADLGTIPSISDQVTAESAKLSLAGLGTIPSINDLVSFDHGANHLLAASALLTDSASRLINEQREWDRIGQLSSSRVGTLDNEWEPRIAVPPIDNSIALEISARSRKEDQRFDQQFALLDAIVEVGKNQNETISVIARLQELLVKEAIENSKLQRTVLYFAALSAALALFALFK